MNISSVRDNTMCSRDRVHERERERKREKRGALSQTRWRARGHCTPPPFDQYCDTLSGFSVALSRLPRLLDLPCSIRRASRVSSMARDFHDGSSGSRGFPLLRGELWLCDRTRNNTFSRFFWKRREWKKWNGTIIRFGSTSDINFGKILLQRFVLPLPPVFEIHNRIYIRVVQFYDYSFRVMFFLIILIDWFPWLDSCICAWPDFFLFRKKLHDLENAFRPKIGYASI